MSRPGWPGLWETRLTLSNYDPRAPSPRPDGCVFALRTGRSTPSRFPLSSRHSLGHLRRARRFHFFPTPLVTFDLACRFLLLEEWLSLLPGCLGGLSSEPGQRKENTLSLWLWGAGGSCLRLAVLPALAMAVWGPLEGRALLLILALHLVAW